MENVILKEKLKMRVLKIIPHRSVLNSTTRKFENTIHDMLSENSNMFPWQHKEGNFIKLREKPSLWWMLSMKSDEISFYVFLPEEYTDTFIIKLKNYKQWSGCTAKDVTDDFDFYFDDNTSLYKMRYKRHDSLSLKFDYSQQTYPVNDILSISDELKEDERFDLIIRTIPENRSKWKKITDYAWSKWEKGSIAPRRGFDERRLIANAFNIFGSIFSELASVVNSTVHAFEKSFFSNPSEEKEKKEYVMKLPDRVEVEANGGPTSKSHKKRTSQVYKTDIRVAINTKDKNRSDALSRTFQSTLKEMSGDNEFETIKININPKRELNDISNFKIDDIDNNLMSTEEVGKLRQLPTKQIQDEFKDKLESNQKIETEIPKDLLEEGGAFMGTTTLRDDTLDIKLPTKDYDMVFTPRVFIGSPRMGKDQAAINFIHEMKNNIDSGAIIPDVIDERSGHRGMADALRDHLPEDKIIDLNLGDFDFPVYLGLSGLVTNKNRRIVSNRIAQELVNFLMADDLSNHQTREHLREFAKASNGDLMEIKLLCLSEQFRKDKIEELKELNLDTLFIENFNKLSDNRKRQIVDPILVRLGELLGDEFLKPIFGQKPNKDINFRKWMEEGKVVILRIPSRDLGEMAVKTIVHWIVLITFLTRLSMNNIDKGCFLVLNEPHQFLSDGLIHFCKRLLAEGPKYRMSPIFLLHNFKQVPKDFEKIILSSSVNWHIFKNTNYEVYEKLENYISPTFEPDDALKVTKRFHYISCWLDASGEYYKPFMMKAPNLISKRTKTYNNSKLTKEHSKIYGTHIDDVLSHIREQQELALK